MRPIVAATAVGAALLLRAAPAEAQAFCDGTVTAEAVTTANWGPTVRYFVELRNVMPINRHVTVTARMPWSMPRLQPLTTNGIAPPGRSERIAFAYVRTQGDQATTPPSTAEMARLLVVRCR